MMLGLVPTCREVTDLYASGDAGAAPWWRRAGVRLHLVMCIHCSRFARQMLAISQALRDAWSASRTGDIGGLKRRIVGRLRSP